MTRGSKGVVAELSKYAARPSREFPRMEKGEVNPSLNKLSGIAVVGAYRWSLSILSSVKVAGDCDSERVLALERRADALVAAFLIIVKVNGAAWCSIVRIVVARFLALLTMVSLCKVVRWHSEYQVPIVVPVVPNPCYLVPGTSNWNQSEVVLPPSCWRRKLKTIIVP